MGTHAHAPLESVTVLTHEFSLNSSEAMAKQAPLSAKHRRLRSMMTRSNRIKGFFVSFAYSSDALTEIDAFFRRSGKVIIPLTVNKILNEQIARTLA